MWRESWNYLLPLIGSFLLTSALTGQNNDCVRAQVICSDGPVNFTPRGPGIDDFANPNNRAGCLQTRENESAWYYFEFRRDMPPNSVIEFSINPFGGYGEDYDFAIYGPDLRCDSLGDPLRCSFAWFECDFCPLTGLGMGATATSQDVMSDGFVAPMVVQPGEGYYMLLDNFGGTSRGFTLTWGGSAAPFLNCQANPVCRDRIVNAGIDRQVCTSDGSFRLDGSAANVGANVTYTWLGMPEALALLSDVNDPNAMVTIPNNFTGTLQFILSIRDETCVLADEVLVTVVPDTPPQITGDTAICNGETTLLRAEPGYQSYRWSTGQTSADITVNAPGTYTVTVTNSNNCESEASFTVTRSPDPQLTIGGGTVVCLDDPLRLDAGTGFTSYQWSTGATTSFTEVLSAGIYSVTVTNDFGCEAIAQTSVTEGRKPNFNVEGDNTFCFGTINTLRTDVAFTQYAWSSGATTATLDVSESGTYSVTVTDTDGCRAEAELTVTRKEVITPTVQGMPAFCAGEATRLTAPPGFANYLWSNNATTTAIDINTPGTYRLTVTDADGCQGEGTVDVLENPLPVPIIEGATGICPDAIATLQSRDSFPVYRWSTGAATPAITIATPGVYTLEVESAAGCRGSVSTTLAAFDAASVEVAGDLIFCPDTGGELFTTTPFTRYEWSNGDTTARTQVFQSGTYRVTVIDANGCAATDTLTVESYVFDNPPVGADTSLCAGTQLTIDAGVNFPFYEWSNGATGRAISVATGGAYTVTVTDAQGCRAEATFNVTENAAPAIAIQGDTGLCPSAMTTLSAVGNFTRINWSNGATEPMLAINTPGLYRATVFDVNNCSAEAEVEVIAFAVPTLSVDGPDAICGNAAITIMATPGFTDYTWNDGPTTPERIITNGGTYTLTVRDANGCTGMASINITQRDVPSLSVSGDSFFCAGEAALLEATPGYTVYNWSNGDTSRTIRITTPGSYTLNITDAFGCTATEDIDIREVARPTADAGADQTLDCNRSSVSIGNNSSDLQYIWQGPGIDVTNQNQSNPVVSVAGLYTLVTTDPVHGCRSDTAEVIVVDQSYVPQIELAATGVLDCRTANVLLDATKSVIGPSIVYRWYNEAGELLGDTPELTVDAPGRYTLEIADLSLGCTNRDSVQVAASYDFPQVNAGPMQLITCDQSTVTLDGANSANGAGFVYNWTTADGNILTGASTPLPLVDQPGIYVLTVFNQNNGCRQSDSVEVRINQMPPVANAGSDQILDCNVPEVTIGNSGTNGNLRYAWSADNGFTFANPQLPVVSVNRAGRYLLRVTNPDNGCSATDTVQVMDNSNYPTDVQTQIMNPVCQGDATGQIVIQGVNGGTAPYFFSLNGAAFELTDVFDSLTAGNYELTVEDVSGCQYQTTLSLKDGMTLRVDLGEDIFVKTGTEVWLEPIVNVPRGTITNLRWDGGALKEDCICWQQMIVAERTERYRVTATNALGCMATDTIQVTVDSLGRVFVPNAFSPNEDGYNDRFMIFSGEKDVLIERFQVFDRWGSRVFMAEQFLPNDPQYGWDGKLNGQFVNTGVYVYTIEVQFYGKNRVLLTGDVTLMR